MSPFSHNEYDNHLRISFVADPDTGLRAINAHESAAKIDGIGATVAMIFDNAKRQNITTEAAAHALAQDLISQFE